MGKTFVEDERPCDQCVNRTRYGCASWDCKFIDRDEAIKAWKEKHDTADRKTEPQYSEDDMYWLSLAEDVANGKMSDAGANQAWYEYINRKTEPTISKMEQVDKPKTQTETQNSNLTFEKRTMRDCYNCKRYETEGECIECHYEPKDEPQTERSK